MRTIYKYPLGAGATAVPIHMDAVILCVQMQGDRPCLWAIVDTDREKQYRWFATVGTGHGVPDSSTYIGTVQMLGGALVWHVFELATALNGRGHTGSGPLVYFEERE